MDFTEINQILDLMREHGLTEFELERDNFKIRLQKQGSGHWVASAPAHAGQMAPPPPTAAATAAGSGAPAPAAEADEDMELAIMKSPIVGTFYQSSEPGAKPFAEVGDTVRKGQVLCIIEAMKLMNEINAEIDGEIVKVYVENGHAVQYGERLFAIKPA